MWIVCVFAFCLNNIKPKEQENIEARIAIHCIEKKSRFQLTSSPKKLLLVMQKQHSYWAGHFKECIH